MTKLNNKDLYYAFALIDEDLIDRTETAPSSAVSVKPLRRISPLALSSSFVFAVLLIVGNKPQDNVLPFTLMAYAEDENGTLVANGLALKKEIPISVFSSYTDGRPVFLFSYKTSALQERPHYDVFDDDTIFSGEDCRLFRIISLNPFDLEISKVKIKYHLQENTDYYHFVYKTVPYDSSERYVFDISIYKKGDEYYACLNSVETEPYEDSERHRQYEQYIAERNKLLKQGIIPEQ